MMERRLKLAKRLLNPESSVLITAIDEREIHRLALLLEQTFQGADIQMVTSVISAKGVVRPGKFSRVEEHLFVVTVGAATARPWFRNMLDPIKGDKGHTAGLEWLGLRRREPSSRRGERPHQFYPIFVDARSNTIHSIGDPVEDDVVRHSVTAPEGTRAVWPLKPDGDGDAVGSDSRRAAPELARRIRPDQQEGDRSVPPNRNYRGHCERGHYRDWPCQRRLRPGHEPRR